MYDIRHINRINLQKRKIAKLNIAIREAVENERIETAITLARRKQLESMKLQDYLN